MAEDNGAKPLPRRVPGATDSPRPPTRVEQSVLPESVRQHLLMVLAEEHEYAAQEPQAPPPDKEQAPPQDKKQVAAPPRPWAPGGSGPPEKRTPSGEERARPERAGTLGKAGSPHKAGHPEPAAPAEPSMPPSRQPPGEHDSPPRQPVTTWDVLTAPPPVVEDEALTEPFSRISAPVKRNLTAPATPEVTEATSPPEPEVAPNLPVAVAPASNGRMVGQQVGHRQRRLGRGYRLAGVLVSVAVLIIAGSLGLLRHGRSATTGAPGGHRQPPASWDGQSPRSRAARSQAAAFVADQIGPGTIVSADPVMFRMLEMHGIPAKGLYELGPQTTSPLRSAVIVATPAVRAQFGTLLSSAYAPAVLASFGHGSQRVDIREVAHRGAAAYRSVLAADFVARKSSAAELLRSNRITVSPTARTQLAAGRADSRLLIMVAAMAAKRPLYIVAFNSFAPGADANMPLRFADLTPVSSGRPGGSGALTPGFVRSMVTFLQVQQAPFRPLRVAPVRLADGQSVLRIEFAAPSPLGLFGSH
jgi:hypothetical protein